MYALNSYIHKEMISQRNGIIIQKKRAEGAPQVQLFQERRKLIKKNLAALLKCSNTNCISNNENPSPSSNKLIVKNTWRSITQEGAKKM